MAELRDRRLAVVIDDRHAGDLVEAEGGRLILTYSNLWRFGAAATPVSLSMPLRQQTHPDAVVRPFTWGLLPDNEQVLERWGQQYQVSSRNPFALLSHVGEDCAGAVQFVRPDRLEQLLAGEGGVHWIDEQEIARRIRILRQDPSAWHLANSNGQFSLAGAQAKTALLYDPKTRGWGDPWGRVPTTHILKPAVRGLDEHDLNEHLCLEAARFVGINAALSRVESFEDERVIVVERYDRIHARDGQILRIHQEDICQALGLSPTAKYQNEGGPSPERIVELLGQTIRPVGVAGQNIARFVDALAFNWIIAGTDAHAKNYSLLLSGPQVRLAPLYDVASALPYEDMYLPKLRVAMRVGGEYRLEAISGRHWRRFAEENSLDPDTTIARIEYLVAQAPDAFAKAAGAAPVRELGSQLPGRLTSLIAARARQCGETLVR